MALVVLTFREWAGVSSPAGLVSPACLPWEWSPALTFSVGVIRQGTKCPKIRRRTGHVSWALIHWHCNALLQNTGSPTPRLKPVRQDRNPWCPHTELAIHPAVRSSSGPSLPVSAPLPWGLGAQRSYRPCETGELWPLQVTGEGQSLGRPSILVEQTAPDLSA